MSANKDLPAGGQRDAMYPDYVTFQRESVQVAPRPSLLARLADLWRSAGCGGSCRQGRAPCICK